jgi:hypothetical protein
MLRLLSKSREEATKHADETAPDKHPVELLTFRRHHYYYPDPHQVSEVASIFYAAGGSAHEITATITWEALALLRRELSRHGESMPDDELVEMVLCRYVQDHLDGQADAGAYDGARLVLDFDGGPRSSGPRDMLQLCGILN